MGQRQAAGHDDIPYCRRCQLHYRSAVQRALGTLARVPAIGFTILAVLLSLGMLMDVFVGFFLQLVVVVAMFLAGWTYFHARAEIQNGFTAACSAGETPAVSFGLAHPAGLRFRFCSREYAERFAAANPRSSMRVLL